MDWHAMVGPEALIAADAFNGFQSPTMSDPDPGTWSSAVTAANDLEKSGVPNWVYFVAGAAGSLALIIVIFVTVYCLFRKSERKELVKPFNHIEVSDHVHGVLVPNPSATPNMDNIAIPKRPLYLDNLAFDMFWVSPLQQWKETVPSVTTDSPVYANVSHPQSPVGLNEDRRSAPESPGSTEPIYDSVSLVSHNSNQLKPKHGPDAIYGNVTSYPPRGSQIPLITTGDRNSLDIYVEPNVYLDRQGAPGSHPNSPREKSVYLDMSGQQNNVYLTITDK